MAAREAGEEGSLRIEDNLRVERLNTPHIYPVARFHQAPAWQKPIWHLQDHVDDRVGRVIAARVATFAPDVVVIHYLQGFGYRTLEHLARCAVPTAYVLHDLGLACIRMSMFRNGRDCVGQCAACRISGAFKNRWLANLAAAASLGFISPSQAMLDSLDRYVPIKQHPHARLLNTKSYPVSGRPRPASDTLRLLYVGKLDTHKGIEVLFEAVDRLVGSLPISLTVAGAGPLQEDLLAHYGHAPWLRFLGFVSQDVLADEMAQADVLCVPSLWQENSPGVVIQALSNGLPVAATDRGGLSELVEDGRNGILLRRHDAGDWVEQLTHLARDRTLLERLQRQAADDWRRFDQDTIGQETIAFLEGLIESNAARSAATA
ncbi:glycosyltransferase [uncultured Sphingomonas sp.]|uniref:glycosyltransferase n=1 Tax=uncultured Sphingomonas sp. TaxID=158754 RepID=UPI0035CAB1E6